MGGFILYIIYFVIENMSEDDSMRVPSRERFKGEGSKALLDTPITHFGVKSPGAQ